jgi:hypothetical protein
VIGVLSILIFPGAEKLAKLDTTLLEGLPGLPAVVLPVPVEDRGGVVERGGTGGAALLR